MGLSMGARREITRATAARYRKANRKGKGQMLNEFCELTGYNRCYAGFLLRNYGKSRMVGKGAHTTKLVPVKGGSKPRGRPRKYGDELQKALKGLWARFDFLCGKRMEPFLRTALPLMHLIKRSYFPKRCMSSFFRSVLPLSTACWLQRRHGCA